jgi:hypothetical protein
MLGVDRLKDLDLYYLQLGLRKVSKMIQILMDRFLMRFHLRHVPSWARRPDPFLPRLRPSYRWWVRY